MLALARLEPPTHWAAAGQAQAVACPNPEAIGLIQGARGLGAGALGPGRGWAGAGSSEKLPRAQVFLSEARQGPPPHIQPIRRQTTRRGSVSGFIPKTKYPPAQPTFHSLDNPPPPLCAMRSPSACASPSRMPSPSPSRLFEVGPVPSGAPYLGAIATATIAKDTLVVHESPLFTLDAPLQSFLFQRTVAAGPGGGPTPVEGEEDDAEVIANFRAIHGRDFDLEDWMERAIKVHLLLKTDEQRARFWDLAATKQGLEQTQAWNIFTTNAIS